MGKTCKINNASFSYVQRRIPNEMKRKKGKLNLEETTLEPQ